MSLIKLTLATWQGQEGHSEINSSEIKGFKKGSKGKRSRKVPRTPGTSNGHWVNEM